MCKADNLPPSCAVVTNSGNPNFLEHPGPVQACNGTALPFLLYWIAQLIKGVFHLDSSFSCWFRGIRVPFTVFWHLQHNHHRHGHEFSFRMQCCKILIYNTMSICINLGCFNVCCFKVPFTLSLDAINNCN